MGPYQTRIVEIQGKVRALQRFVLIDERLDQADFVSEIDRLVEKLQDIAVRLQKARSDAIDAEIDWKEK